MNCHQVLSGACNSGDQCFAVGSVEGIPFTAYAAGCNIVILASNFERVQIISGAIHGYVRIGSLDCSTDTGKIAAAYGPEVCIFEPTPLIHSSATTHGLEYRWVQTGKLLADGPLTALSWNLEGTRLLTGGKILQLWHQASLYQDDSQPSSGVTFQIGGSDKDDKPKQIEEDEPGWICVWQCQTATHTHHLAFSPDGVLFATSGVNDRLVKIWYQNKVLVQTHTEHSATDLNYTFIYVAHPRAVTHLSWRKTSKYMPKGSVGNVLVTSCVDNICRVWAETLLPEDEGASSVCTRGAPRRHRATHRHKHRFMQRLKHMKTCFHIRRTAASSKLPGAPIPTLPSTYSAHDFHTPYHASSYTGGLHFHLAASINAETDIPLVPSLSAGGRFILHWLHNKEMHFTSQAEALLHDLTKKILDKEESEEGSDAHHDHDNDKQHRRASQLSKMQSEDNSNSDENQQGSNNHSHPSLSNTTSINSIATDVTCTHLPDSLDAKIEGLLRDWHQSPDLLFSIHPVDGSFLIWVCEWLDEVQAGAIRQAQVSFSARIPSALPLGDATTMCTPAALYHAAAQPLYVRHRTKPVTTGPQQGDTVTTPLASVQEEKDEAEWTQNEAEKTEKQDNGQEQGETPANDDLKRKTSVAADELDENQDGGVLDSAPVISMVTNHTNGTLNLWQLTFDDKSKFTQVLSIGHASRASGHRFRVNDITCHPVLPLLLTTSHHNISDLERTLQPPSSSPGAATLCSELIMWRVECVGPLGKSGGVAELARVNSPHLSAFSNVAWLPTLLPSTTLGNLSNSPSACFVASDGESLRVFQAVIDARTLLAEISTSERRHNNAMDGDTISQSSQSTTSLEQEGVPLHSRIKIVSQQSTARPGAVIQLHAIQDATHDWHNTQLLHVFQEQLITGERTTADLGSAESVGQQPNGLMEAGLEAIVDLRRSAVFSQPFYIVVLERTDGGSTVHMWRLTVSSQSDPQEQLTSSMMYVPDSALIQEEDGESRKNSVCFGDDRPQPKSHTNDAHISITTKKVCECELALPEGVDVIHATPAAGHLSSASIYPACLAPYTLATACSDSTLRFWKCHVTKKEDGEYDYAWKEWEMLNKDQASKIDIPGQPLHISAAYSGRIACAYKCGRSFTRPKGGSTNNTTASNTDARFVNLSVCVYECESTGGAEWLLEDTIPLRNVSLPRVGVGADTQIDLSYLNDSSFLQKRQRLTQVLQTLSHEEPRGRNGESENNKPTGPGLLAVPSFSTLQSLRKSIMENGNTCPLTQKHLVQLDWVSKEDGSHILTVAVGSRVLLFTPVSSDLAQANLKAMKESLNNNRPILRKASSLATPVFVEEIRWMQLRRIDLKTADGLPPLPMQISWVRDGILVVGMDSEMHVYSQWKPENSPAVNGMVSQDCEESPSPRALRDSDLRISAPHLQRVSSINLQLLERDAKRRKGQTDQPQPLLDYMPDYGLFEASQMACPVLPQYHPKQLMELLNSGKIRWVKAILAHLVRCIGGSFTGRSSQGDEDSLSRQRGWSRSRTMSVSFAAGAASPLDGGTQITEDVQLDYAELTSVPPLPLWTLLVADKESLHNPSTAQEAKDYGELFDGTMETDEDLDALLQEEEDGVVDRRPSMPERQPLSYFGLRQGRILSRMLTHTHLPGLSSLDQMHLLALADTVSTCDSDFQERLATVRNDVHQPQQEISPDSLDDCGLRFLLAMKHYGYLLRCLPLGQRATLQRNGVGTCNLVWAFHSETHAQLLQLLPGYAKGQPQWPTMRELGVGWWLRGRELLRTFIEVLARAAYKRNHDPMDAALYYLAMKKKALLWGLFRSHRDEKMTSFFANNFSDERWRKAALKNAFALLGKQRFEHAAAFFLLGGALKDALEVLITRLGDLQLAMIVSRLYEADCAQLPESLKKLLNDEVLGGETPDGEIDTEKCSGDPFARSMALWELRRYTDSLQTLVAPSKPQIGESRPSVFNFYVYLRTHPRLKRQNLPKQGGTVALLQQESDEGITRLERRLYFQTAHGHFKAGCPALALEVLSKLPNKIREEKKNHTQEDGMDDGMIGDGDAKSGVSKSEPVDWAATSAAVDWSAPVSTSKNDELVLSWDDDGGDKGSESGSSTPPLEMKIDRKDSHPKPEEQDKSDSEETRSVDIMAQQLKFVACLKILMEELSTLATGFEVDGGHLRYQLYIWLEREVAALSRLCGYGGGGGGGALVSPEPGPPDPPDRPDRPDRPTLHQLLLREKHDFEAKVQRAVQRNTWLNANETLLRTLLSYCSLQGAGGGGLASVRMELILLLQELGQDKHHQQLLSPLPFPTTLPLLAAAVNTNNTVVADPVRHLQSVAHDMLASIGELGVPGSGASRLLHTLRELSVALSACIYQSLCDADTFQIRHSHTDSFIHDVPGSTHVLARNRRQSTEELTVTSPPNKWPGVSVLRGLALRAAEEEEAPRLAVLLGESFVAVYVALLGWALAARDAHLLYRLAAAPPSPRAHARLFGGGVRRLLTTAPSTQPKLVERPEGTSVWSSLREKRALLNMKLLGLGPAAPHKNIQEGRPTYREQFVPPQCSILTFLLTKPTETEVDPSDYDYDSGESGAEDGDPVESDSEDDDVFDTTKKEKRRIRVNVEHSDPDSYSWYLMRVAVLKLAQHKLQTFLQLCGIEMSELATTSPMVHGCLRRVSQWQDALLDSLEARPAPPDYIPGCFPDDVDGPPINKYRCLLEKHNTPFNPNLFSAAPARRLWSYLVRQEHVQELFIRCVFSRRRGTTSSSYGAGYLGSAGEERGAGCLGRGDVAQHSPVRIIHKDQDSIAAFCLNKVGGSLLAVATAREVSEMDVSLLLRGGAAWAEDECEVDLLSLGADPTALPDTGFLLIHHQDRPNQSSIPSTGNTSPLNSTPPVPVGMASQTGRGASVVLKHKIDNIKRMAAHPSLPLYLTGGADGSVQLWEWGHPSCVWSPRAPGAYSKVTRVRFSDYGNKFAVADANGNLAAWQLHPPAPAPASAGPEEHAAANTRPFFTHLCHNKGISDFVFLGSCSLIATAGHSSESKNVAIWDTLMPIKKALVVAWTCLEGGATCLAWAGSGLGGGGAGAGALVAAGRRGEVHVWDVRSRAPRHKIHATPHPVRCIALTPEEDKYALGTQDGDIKVFSMSTHQLLHTFAGEHARSSFFKPIGQGVTQIYIDNQGRLFSCGADGTMKVRKLPEREGPTFHQPQY